MGLHLYSTVSIADTTSPTVTLESFDRVIVTQDGELYWYFSDSGIFATTYSFGKKLDVHGIIDVGEISLGAWAEVFVAAGGSIRTRIGLEIGETNAGGSSYVNNFGTIFGDFFALSVLGGLNVVVNEGAMIGNLDGVILGGDYGSSDWLINRGSITALGDGVLAMGAYATITNSGLISGQTGVVLEGEAVPLGGTDTSMYLNNYGTIIGSDAGVRTDMVFALSSFQLVNTGTISSTVNALLCGVETDTIINRGTLNGRVELGAGNDTFDTRGGTVNGLVYGGTGSDTYYISDAGIQIYEVDGEVDYVHSTVSYWLPMWVEQLFLLGTADTRGDGNSSGNYLEGNSGDNRLSGFEGGDSLSGFFGNDTLTGGAGNDALIGEEGNDMLLGGAGADSLIGGAGDDTLIGGLGKDTLWGGEGRDTFVFQAANHSMANTANADVIRSFVKNEDRIDLSAIDAITTNALADDSFTFIGSAAFTDAGQVRVVQTATITYVYADTSGDGIADTSLKLAGSITLTAADFLL